MSLRIWHLWGSTIFGSRRLIKVIPISAIKEISQLSVVKHMHTFKELYPSKSRYKHITLPGGLFPARSHM